MKSINTILVPLDMSESSALVFTSACRIARQLGSDMVVMHAVAMSAVALPVEGQAVYSDEMITELISESKQTLRAFLDDHNEEGLEIGHYVCLGEPTVEINKYAEDQGVDLIIMGTHGRTGLSHLLIGSVAEYVLRHSRIPVMSIPYK